MTIVNELELSRLVNVKPGVAKIKKHQGIGGGILVVPGQLQFSRFNFPEFGFPELRVDSENKQYYAT